MLISSNIEICWGSTQYEKSYMLYDETTDQSVFLKRYPKCSKKYTVSKLPHALVTYCQNNCQIFAKNVVVNQPSCALW